MHVNHFDWIKKWAKYTPTKMALREDERDISWSYAQLNQRVEQLALYLSQEKGIKKGDRIAIYSKNNAEYVFLFFAAIKIEAILVPLNFRLMPAELDLLLEDAKPTLFIYETGFLDNVNKITALNTDCIKEDLAQITPFLVDEISDKIYEIKPQYKEEDVVMILYTSGTTGRSKGAVITHKMLFWNAVNTSLRLDINSMDHCQGYAPFFHTGGWNVLFTPFVHAGASTTLLTNFDTERILTLMEKEKSTILFGVPTMMQMLADSPLFNKVNLSSVRYAIVGGAPMPIPLINIWHEKGIMVRQGYGLTEVGPNCFSLHQDDAIRKRGSIGFPNFYIEAKVVAENGEECAANQVGELWLKSPVVTPGYWERQEATQEAITNGWFHTGDMVMKDEEDYYYVVDRKKNMFISGGENVYPAEVERFLYTHPAIIEVAVIGVEDSKWGEVGMAFITLKKDEQLSAEDVLAFCKGKIAKYKTPKHVRFLDEIPKNDTGKINRIALNKLTN